MDPGEPDTGNSRKVLTGPESQVSSALDMGLYLDDSGLSANILIPPQSVAYNLAFPNEPRKQLLIQVPILCL